MIRAVNANPRQLLLLEHVRQHRALSLGQLAQRLGVTGQTVRRDVRRLADAGLLARFHGGVRVPGSSVENLHHHQRQSLHAAAKARIARALAQEVPQHCSLILNIGTTTEAVAHALLQHQGLRVLTNNLNVAAILGRNPGCEVLVVGGALRAHDQGVVGAAAADFIARFKVDIAVIGISAIEADGSLRDFDLREVQVTQAIMRQSRAVWLAADASKFKRVAMVEVAPLVRIDRLFTDEPPAAPFATLLADAGVACTVA